MPITYQRKTYGNGPYQAAFRRLSGDELLVRYLNAIETTLTKTTAPRLVLEACVFAYAPELVERPRSSLGGRPKYTQHIEVVNNEVMVKLLEYRRVDGKPLTELVVQAVRAWIRAHVVKLVMLDREQAVFVWDEEKLEMIGASAPPL